MAYLAGRNADWVALNDGGTADLTAPKIFLDTGTASVIPAIPGL
jgi:hypothetical protein